MDSFENDPDEGISALDPAGMITGIMICILCVATILGTFFLFIVYFTNKALRTPHNILLLYLSAASVCMCTGRLVFTASAVAHRAYRWGKLGCEIDGFLTVFINHICISAYSAMGLERYLTIVRQMTLDRRHFAAVVVLNFTWATVSTTSTYWGDRTGKYHALQPSKTYCTLDWWTSVYLTQITCMATVLGSLIIFAISYFKLVAAVRAHSLEWKETDGYWVSEETLGEPTDVTQWQQPKFCKLVTEKSALFVLTFLANWLVYAYIILYSMIAQKPVPKIVDCIGVVLVFNNPFCTVLLILFLDKRWRKAARWTLGLQDNDMDPEKAVQDTQTPQTTMTRRHEAMARARTESGDYNTLRHSEHQ